MQRHVQSGAVALKWREREGGRGEREGEGGLGTAVKVFAMTCLERVLVGVLYVVSSLTGTEGCSSN